MKNINLFKLNSLSPIKGSRCFPSARIFIVIALYWLVPAWLTFIYKQSCCFLQLN